MSTLLRHRSSEFGATLVETAIVLIMMLLVVFGIIDGARYIATRNTVNTASHEAARYGSSVGVAASGQQRFVDCDGIRAAGIALSNGAITAAQIDVNYDEGPNSTPNGKCDAGQSATRTVREGDRIVITVTDEWRALTPLVEPFFGPFTVTSVVHRTILSP